MTVQDFSTQVVQNMDLPGYQLDPITLAILMTIITTVVAYYVQKCLDDIHKKKARNLNMIERWQVKRKLSAEFKNHAPHLKDQYLEPLFNSLLKTADQQNEQQVKMIVASCKPV